MFVILFVLCMPTHAYIYRNFNQSHDAVYTKKIKIKSWKPHSIHYINTYIQQEFVKNQTKHPRESLTYCYNELLHFQCNSKPIGIVAHNLNCWKAAPLTIFQLKLQLKKEIDGIQIVQNVEDIFSTLRTCILLKSYIYRIYIEPPKLLVEK